jgi:tRNA threonylcarbamoyladenosine biosynthesis protein TsaB
VLVLAFDTATDVATACVVRDGRAIAEHVGTPGPRAAQSVLRVCDELLAGQGLRAADVDAVVVGVGPGSYTGLRLGIAAARALGLALGVPVAGVSTLDALRAGAGAAAAAVIDARRGEVFAAGSGLDATVLAPADLAARLEAGTALVGDGAVRYRGIFEAAGHLVPPDDDPRHAPRAGELAAIAERDGYRSSSEPHYLRRPDAEARAA